MPVARAWQTSVIGAPTFLSRAPGARIMAGLRSALAIAALVTAMPLQAQDQAGGSIAECDRLAASELDPDRPATVPGVPIFALEAATAVPACEAAVKVAPKNRRIMFELGRAYQVAKDYEKARLQYGRAEALGSVVAANNLATLFDQGLGGAKDPAKAKQLFEKAAAGGIYLAMYSLGGMYEEGRGVPQHFVLAWQWYEKAAAAGFARAMTKLGIFCEKGLAVGKDYGEARRWFEKAAALGETSAMVLLGVLYENGLGVAKDLAAARHWYEMAAAAGDETAKELLNKLATPGAKN
jgi:uncharacterized protein